MPSSRFLDGERGLREGGADQAPNAAFRPWRLLQEASVVNLLILCKGLGCWFVELKDLPGGKPAIPHKCQVKIRPSSAENMP